MAEHGLSQRRACIAAAMASEQLADELQEWLLKPDMGRVEQL